jgi:hypothetical protein
MLVKFDWSVALNTWPRKFANGLQDKVHRFLTMAPAVDKPGMSAQEAAAINAAAVTRNYSVKPRLQYQTVSAVSGMAT